MKDSNEGPGSWFAIAAIAAIYVLPFVCLESQVVSRPEVTVAGMTFDAVVWQDRSLSYGLTRVYLDKGKLMTRLGVLAGKGRMPVTFTRAASPEEIALYHRTVS